MIVHNPGPRTEFGQHCVDCGLEFASAADVNDEWEQRPIVETNSRLPDTGRRLKSVKTVPKHAKPCVEAQNE